MFLCVQIQKTIITYFKPIFKPTAVLQKNPFLEKSQDKRSNRAENWVRFQTQGRQIVIVLGKSETQLIGFDWSVCTEPEHLTLICCIILNHQLSWSTGTWTIEVNWHQSDEQFGKSWFNINAKTGVAGVEWPYIIFRCHHNSLCVLYPDAISHVFHIFEEKNMGNTFLLCHIFKNTMIVHNMLNNALFLGMSPAPATARAGRTTPSQVPRWDHKFNKSLSNCIILTRANF